MIYIDKGNLTRDLNRQITQIRYNTVGLPAEIYVDSVCRMTFTYDADGRLLSRFEINDWSQYIPFPGFPTLKLAAQPGDLTLRPTIMITTTSIRRLLLD